jgi:hypothetical protein
MSFVGGLREGTPVRRPTFAAQVERASRLWALH